MVAAAAPLAEVGTVTARVSELPAHSDRAAVVRAAPLDEAMDNALDVVGVHDSGGSEQIRKVFCH